MKKIKIKHHCFINILVLFSLFSCSLKEIKKEAPQNNLISINQKYKINLPENHFNGYIWQLSEGYDDKIIDHINTVWHGNEKGIDFNFKPLAIGQTTLTFILRKYTDTSAVKHFIVQINKE